MNNANNSFEDFLNYAYSIVGLYEQGNEEKYKDIRTDLKVIEEKINDEDLYLGVVGSFSSGKSTFINSIIHKNLLPSDAVQGTTVAASVLKKSEFNDLEIVYTDGRKRRYSESSDELIHRYHFVEENIGTTIAENQSIIHRIIDWLKRILGIQPQQKVLIGDSKHIELFKKIISTEELATDIQSVTLYYKNDNIPYKIAMVDTPGTESLNRRHNEVTKDAIDNICDAIVVIIPYDEPVSEELLDYVNNNLEEHKQECIFVVTKVELIGDLEELPLLLRVIKKRLENGLFIESAKVIPMPTLLYLKSVDYEMKTTFLDGMPEEEKRYLLQMYENGVLELNSILNVKRKEFIKKKIVNICDRVISRINTNLTDIVVDFDEKNKKLHKEAVKPLIEFEQQVGREFKKLSETRKQRLNGELSFVDVSFSAFRTQTEKTVDGCNDSQELIDSMSFSIVEVLRDIQSKTESKLEEISEIFNKTIQDLNGEFYSEYSRCGVTANVNRISVNTNNLFNNSFVNECNLILLDCTARIKTSISNDTSGFFKKVKSLFSNPIARHKEMAITQLSNTIDELVKKVKRYVSDEGNKRITDAENDGVAFMLEMVNYNRQGIENYISNTNRAINKNKQGRERTQADIVRLIEYKNLMKEDV